MGLLLLCLGSAVAQKPYDLLLKGGHLIDPKNEINAPRDVAIAKGKIVAVGEDLDTEKAEKVVDVSGLYVMPGLVDIHAHVFTGTGRKGVLTGDTSVYPDGFSFRSGVTTLVDVGSSGRRNFEEFKKLIIDRAATRILSMLNIGGGGMGGGKIEQNVDDMEPDLTAQMAKKYPDIIVGIKTAHFAGPEWVAVDRAVEAGRIAKIPVMVDFGNFRPERPFEELVLEHLRPGDMYTHFFIGRVPMLDHEGKVRPYLYEARKRGVKFDVGHGSGSFHFRNAEHEQRHEKHVQRHVEVPEPRRSVRRSRQTVDLESVAANSAPRPRSSNRGCGGRHRGHASRYRQVRFPRHSQRPL